ncbi:MAG: hypothetical protein CBARDMAM_5153 [uncultured Caballeronia sp.]|nr:MAG: hypothetical protein CBARDMAM_5153 [uncultured Caballeronia sp.]
MSFSLAAGDLGEDLLVIEGNVLFDGTVLNRVLRHSLAINVAAVAAFTPPMSGTVVDIGDDDRLIRQVHKGVGVPCGARRGAWKTVNVYRFSAPLVRVLCDIHARVRDSNPFAYLEDLLKLAVDGVEKILTVDCSDCRWYEVDDLADLHNAREVFGNVSN